jgi:SPP1 gp7 family putative phage head morphogenesis protein
MFTRDNKRLFDIAMRSSIYLEGVKAWQVQEFGNFLANLGRELRSILAKLEFEQLDRLTKTQLTKLVYQIRQSQMKLYDEQQRKILETLHSFMNADLEVTRRAYASTFVPHKEDEPEPIPTDAEAIAIIEEESSSHLALFGLLAITRGANRLWNTVVNAPIPANGVPVDRFVRAFTVAAMSNIENLVRQGWANKWTVPQLIAEISGKGFLVEGRNQLQRISAQHSAVIDTAYQHVHSVVQAGVQSALFDRYRWDSIIDSATTDICRSRNNNIYRWGDGPIPPAHIRCRSQITAIVGNGQDGDLTLYGWVIAETGEIQRALLSEAGFRLLEKGELRAKDLKHYIHPTPINVEQLRSKLKSILSGSVSRQPRS